MTAQTRAAGAAVGRASPISPDEVAVLMPETLDLREFLASLEKAVIQRALTATNGARPKLHGGSAFREVTFPISWESTTSERQSAESGRRKSTIGLASTLKKPSCVTRNQ